MTITCFTRLSTIVWALPPPSSGRTQPLHVTNTPFIESAARFSPDGRWIAYQSNDSANGQDVYIQAFPDGGRRHPASVGGGTLPRWARDGKELFYVASDLAMMAVPVRGAGAEIEIGNPTRLFQSRALQGNLEYDVAPDGRFLFNVPVDEHPGNSIAVIVNWSARLKK